VLHVMVMSSVRGPFCAWSIIRTQGGRVARKCEVRCDQSRNGSYSGGEGQTDLKRQQTFSYLTSTFSVHHDTSTVKNLVLIL